jgi:hypothetical protein
MYLIETHSRVRVGKNLSEMFPIMNGLKQGDVLSPVLFKFALEYAIKRVQINKDCLKVNGTHQLLAYVGCRGIMFVGLLNCHDAMVCLFFIRGFGVDVYALRYGF